MRGISFFEFQIIQKDFYILHKKTLLCKNTQKRLKYFVNVI